MTKVGNDVSHWPESAAIFGASGGIGAALADKLLKQGCAHVFAGARRAPAPRANTTPFAFDLRDEGSIADIAHRMRDAPPELVVVATGVLTLADGTGPERTLKRLDPVAMAEVFALNTIGPAIVAKHVLPLMPRDKRFVFAALSARVGSIGDNHLGGWHSYRASKAALNMLIKNFALEVARTHKHGTVIGLHPGTVDSALSQPFQNGLPDGQLTTPEAAASNLLSVLVDVQPDQSGAVFDWQGERIPN